MGGFRTPAPLPPPLPDSFAGIALDLVKFFDMVPYEQVFDLSEPGGQLGLVRDLAGAKFQDPGGSSGLERQQGFFFASTGDEGAVGHHVLFVQFHAVIELRFDLEEVPEILIVVGG